MCSAMARPILRHRILLNFQAESDKLTQDDILKKLLEAVPRPRNSLGSRHAAAFPRSVGPGGHLRARPGRARPWSTGSSRVCTGRRISALARSSPNTARISRAMTCVTWIGTSSRAPRRCYLKRYRGETNCQVSVLLDCSRSMKYGSRGMEKMEYARFLAASICLPGASAARRGGLDRFRQRSAAISCRRPRGRDSSCDYCTPLIGRTGAEHRFRKTLRASGGLSAAARTGGRDFRFLGRRRKR